jgi:hypothetical protein
MGDDTKPAGEGLDESSKPSNGGDETPPALGVIGAFGGIRPMANKLDVPVSTVQGWKERGVIPESRHDDIRAAATAHDVALDDADLDASAEVPPEAHPEAPAEAETGTETGTEAAAETVAAPAQPWTPAAAETDEESEESQESQEAQESAVEDEPPAVAHPIAAAATHGSGQGGRSSWVPGFVLGALVMAVGAGGAVLTKDIWAPAGQTAGTDGGGADGGANGAANGAVAEQLAALDGRLATIEAQPAAASLPENLATADDLRRVEGEIAALSGGADATANLAAELKDLDARLAALGDNATAGAEAATATATALGGLSGEVAAIEASLEEIRAAIDDLKARNADQDALLWSAVGALRDAMRYAGPFSEQLADVSRLAGERAEFLEALAELKPLAASGVASLGELQRAFPATAREIVAAGYGDGDDSVLGDVLNRVSQVITVRPVGEVDKDDKSPGAIVARAEGLLDQGDLAAALEELKGLPGDAGKAADTWSQRAQQRIAADAAITRLNGLLAGQLATGG